METRDLLLLIGFLRRGKMFPAAVPLAGLPAQRSLRILYDAIADRERALFPDLPPPPPVRAPSSPPPPRRRTASSQGMEAALSPVHEDVRRRSAVTTWSGDFLAWTTRTGEVPDPGVVLCLMYEGPAADAALPIDVFAQTLRRYALRDPDLRARFDAHVSQAGTFVPPWLSPEVRRQRSQQAFDRAMAMAEEAGFAGAVPLLEGVRGDCYPAAQIAIAEHEHEVGDAEGALGRLDEVVQAAPRNVSARLARARILAADAGRRVEAAADWLVVLRELRCAPADPDDPAVPLREEARAGLWDLCREFANPRKLEAAAALAHDSPERGFEAVSRYVHTHPCAWDAHLLLGSLALGRQSFELTAKLLADVRWLYPDDPNPHFVYGQALASKGNVKAAIPALEHAARLAPGDRDIAHWLAFARGKLSGASLGAHEAGVKVAHHVARNLLLLVGFVRDGRVYPAALTLHRVPGDVSLALVLQALAVQERRRFGADEGPSSEGEPASVEIDLDTVRPRAVLLAKQGGRLHAEQLVGDVPDPGVLLALLYDAVEIDGAGRPSYSPSPEDCQRTITIVSRADTEIAAKLARHMESPDATLMARLQLSE